MCTLYSVHIRILNPDVRHFRKRQLPKSFRAAVLGPICILQRPRRPNLTIGKLPLGKLHNLEIGTWEIVTWEVALRKMALGKYLTPET